MTSIGAGLARSFRVRILLGYAVIVSLVAVAWAWSLFGPLTDAIVAQQQTHLQSVAQAGALAIGRSADSLPATVRQLVARTDLRVTVVDAGGRVLADSEEDPARMENHAGRPEIAAALAGRIGRDTRVSRTLAIREMYVAVPTTVGGRRAALRVAEPLTRIDELAAGARRGGLLLLLVTIAVSLLVTDRLARRAAEPVTRLAASARAMAAGDLTAAVPAETGELGVLSTALTDLKVELRARMTALESERADLRAVLDGLPDVVLLLEGGRVSMANAGAFGAFPVRAGGWRGRAIEETTMPASLATAIERLVSAGGGADQVGDAAHRRFDVTVSALAPGEAGSRWLVVITDVTERARLDEIRRDFVANASHELKTPLSGIRLLAQSAEMAERDGEHAQALRFVSQIDGEAARLQQLVQDLLDLARLEHGRAVEADTDLRAAIDLAVTGHQALAKRKGLGLSAELAGLAGRDVYVAADATDVAVLLDNVVDNAVTYTDSGSVTIVAAADAERATIEVRDTGVGIPAEALPRVFERFYRVDPARSRVSGGSGLGLSLARHAAERAGGTIEVRSEVGSGTSVTITLPVAR